MHPVERRLDRLERLERVIHTQSLLVQADLDLDGYSQLVVDNLRELTQSQGVAIELVDGEDTRCSSVSGDCAPRVGMRLPRARACPACACAPRPCCAATDSETDDRVDREACRRVGVRSMICTPLFQSGEVIGVLKVFFDQAHAFDSGDVELLGLMAATLAGVLGRQMAIDERSRAEARLRGNEERMRAMLEHAHDAVVSMDDEGRVSQWNRAAERLFGWAPIEAMGQPWRNSSCRRRCAASSRASSPASRRRNGSRTRTSASPCPPSTARGASCRSRSA
jgi:PAS domain-containing protein